MSAFIRDNRRRSPIKMLLVRMICLLAVGCGRGDRAADTASAIEPFTPEQLGLHDLALLIAPQCDALAGNPHGNPLYHDCQGVVESGTYHTSYLLAAIDTKLNTRTDAFFKDSLSGNQVVRVGYILNNGGAAYTLSALGGGYILEPGRVHCVYVGRRGGSEEWRGGLMSCDMHDGREIVNFNEVTSSPFHVLRITAANSNYPIAAAIDWDEATGRHGIGYSCGSGWCVVVPKTTGPRLRPVPGQDSSPHRMVRGWHDQQIVGEIQGGQTFPNRAGAVATIMAVQGLDSLQDQHFENQYVKVADVHFSRLVQSYKDNFNYDINNSDSTRENLIYLHKQDTTWTAMIISASGDTVYRKVKRHVDPPPRPGTPTRTRDPVGAARWGWNPVDVLGVAGPRIGTVEVAWVRCGGGCCEITGEAPARDPIRAPPSRD